MKDKCEPGRRRPGCTAPEPGGRCPDQGVCIWSPEANSLVKELPLPGSGEEVTGEVVLYAEEVDAEVVPDYDDIRWIQWHNPDKDQTCFKMEVDQSWYRRVDRSDWEQLNALLGGIADLVRRTSTRGPRVASAAERAAEGSGSPRKPR